MGGVVNVRIENGRKVVSTECPTHMSPSVINKWLLEYGFTTTAHGREEPSDLKLAEFIQEIYDEVEGDKLEKEKHIQSINHPLWKFFGLRKLIAVQDYTWVS